MDLICKHFPFGYLVLPQDSEDPIVKEYLNGNSPNDYMLTALEETTSPGDLVFDVGCHVGTFAVGAAAMGRRVISIDANPMHVDLVRKSFAINELEGTVLHKAISSSAEPVTFILDGLFGRIDYLGHGGDTISVDTIGLESLPSGVRFLKMDIEGAELQALETGERMLREEAPVIWWESNGPTLELAGRTIRTVRQWLEDHGYRTFRIEGDRWVYAPPSQPQPEAWLDVISLSQKDQQRWSDKIDWEWPDAETRSREWLNCQHPHTIRHLIKELGRMPQTASVSEITTQAEQILQRL